MRAGTGEHFGGASRGARDIQMQLAHLKWRKTVNESKIRTAINASRALGERDLLMQLSVDRTAERAAWRQAVVEDELSKPLEVSERFMKQFEKEAKLQTERYDQQVELHTDALEQQRLLQRGELCALTHHRVLDAHIPGLHVLLHLEPTPAGPRSAWKARRGEAFSYRKGSETTVALLQV